MWFKSLVLLILLVSKGPKCNCEMEEEEDDINCLNLHRFRLPSYKKPAMERQPISIKHPEFTLVLNPTDDSDVIIGDTDIIHVNGSNYENKILNYPKWRYQGSFNNQPLYAAIDDSGKIYASFNYENSSYFIEPHSNDSDNAEQHCYRTYKCSRDHHFKAQARSPPLWMKMQWKGEYAKSSSNSKKKPTEKTSIVCDLRVVVDYPFFKYVAQSNTDKAVMIIIDIVSKLDTLYKTADFTRDGRAENLKFFISDVKVHLDPLADYQNFSCCSQWNPTKFFTEMRNYNFSGVCAGLLFTYRQMQSPELYGPSIFKSTINSSDFGICSTLTSPPIPTGVVNNYGPYISNAVPVNFMYRNQVFDDYRHMAIQAAHQISQLFGAPTDDDTASCNFSTAEAMNIMAYPVPPGNFKENRKFSSCSKESVTKYLNALNRQCLRTCQGPVCSNKRSIKLPLSGYDVIELGTESIVKAKNSATFSNPFFSTLLEISFINLFVLIFV